MMILWSGPASLAGCWAWLDGITWAHAGVIWAAIAATGSAVAAVVALFTVRHSRNAAEASQRTATETARAADAAARSASTLERTVLLSGVPFVFGWRTDHTPTGVPVVRLEAVGFGVAYNITATVSQGAASASTKRISHFQSPKVEATVLWPNEFDLDTSADHEVVVEYQDADGASYRSTRVSLSSGEGHATLERRQRGARSNDWETLLAFTESAADPLIPEDPSEEQ